MGTMAIVATQVKCPECGARLEIHGDAPVAKCAYCGTESRVQRRTAFLELPKRMPERQQHEPKPVAREVRSRKGKIKLAVLVVVVFLLPFGFVGAVMYSLFTSKQWEGNHLSVADCNGDGVEDFIGFARNTSRDRMYLTAYSGKDGDVLWQTASLGTYIGVYQDLISAGGVNGLEIEMVADKLSHLDAYELKTGARRWHVTAPEVVSSFCYSAHGEPPRLETADQRVWTVNIVTGALDPAAGACTHSGAQLAAMRADVSGMEVSKVYELGTGPRVALGYRKPGSRVPMIAALDSAEGVIWKAEVPGHDPLTAKDDLEHVAIADQSIAIVYERSSGTRYELTLFDRLTGKRAFEVELRKKPRVVSGVRITATAVAVETWGTLQVFERSSGALRFIVR